MKGITHLIILTLSLISMKAANPPSTTVVLTEKNQFSAYKEYTDKKQDAFICIVYVRANKPDDKLMEETFKTKLNNAEKEGSVVKAVDDKTGVSADKRAQTVTENPNPNAPVLDNGTQTQSNELKTGGRLLETNETPEANEKPEIEAEAKEPKDKVFKAAAEHSLIIECRSPKGNGETEKKEFKGICKSERLGFAYKSASTTIYQESCLPFGERDDYLLFATDGMVFSEKNKFEFLADVCVLKVSSAGIVSVLISLAFLIVNMF